MTGLMQKSNIFKIICTKRQKICLEEKKTNIPRLERMTQNEVAVKMKQHFSTFTSTISLRFHKIFINGPPSPSMIFLSFLSLNYTRGPGIVIHNKCK